ncbi:PIN domain-containing protein [Kineosporia sp. J2-2]|uniref:PIN domain-containing protein n=1 Tax=Kineosporia corallincola TaxID=2835133 RepID=A0ABS5TSM6_9ACTN|nr:PIN domain-containing protein [Kineosporia corallincola]MBT0773804.1 PIN domain-containing protein [Kineosporia corallincola]
MNVGWLLDSSAIGLAHYKEVAARLRPMLRAGVLYTCPVLDLEALGTAGTPQAYRKMRVDRQQAYRSVPFGPAVGERAVRLQAKLGPWAGPPVRPRDLLVAATALEYDLTVLHHHPAFPLLGEVSELDQRAVADLNTLE